MNVAPPASSVMPVITEAGAPVNNSTARNANINNRESVGRAKVEQMEKDFVAANTDGYGKNYFKLHSRKKGIEDILVYQALRDQKKMELLMKVRELRHVQIKEKYFDSLIRLYDMNISRYFHYNTETLPFTVLGIMLIFIGNIFINMSFTQN